MESRAFGESKTPFGARQERQPAAGPSSGILNEQLRIGGEFRQGCRSAGNGHRNRDPGLHALRGAELDGSRDHDERTGRRRKTPDRIHYLAAQRLGVQAALARQHDVGMGQGRPQANRITHQFRPRDRFRSEQRDQGQRQAAGCTETGGL